MKRADLFEFSDASSSLDEEAFVVVLPEGLSRVDDLFEVLQQRAKLPSYFGFNWNALSDCLRDLHWIQNRKVILWHNDLPGLPPEELNTYIDVLAECVESWSPQEAHSLKVIFPLSTRSRITALLTA